MIAPFLAASLLAGYGTTTGLGYAPGPQVAASLSAPRARMEAGLDFAHKTAPGDGWAGNVAGEVGGSLSIGARYTRLHTSAWDKSGPWLRVAYRKRGLALLAEAASGHNRERKIEARYGSCWSGMCLESRWFAEWHSAGFGYGVAVLAGIGAKERKR